MFPPQSDVDRFEAKRQDLREEYLSKLFLLGGWIGGTDTYKRTMWTALPDIALAPACYALTMRKGLPEPGTDNQLIMAGHEAMLAQWFHRPLKRTDILLAAEWYARESCTKVFPRELWDAILAAQPGEDIRLPVDIWGFPGGQTFLPGVPCLSFEGMGGAISYLEPAMCRYFAPIIQATKARLMKLTTPRDAEFGLRSAPVEVSNLILLLARYVGGRGQLTSNDTAEFLYPDLFQSVGTVGHELMCAGQSFDRTLAEAEFEMMDRYVSAMGKASLLCDLVDAESVGMENALRVMKAHPSLTEVGIRVDSGDVPGQCIRYFERMCRLGVSPRLIVFEDEVTPETVRRVYEQFRAATGVEPTMLFPGAGGYWWRLVHRDTLGAAFKRSATAGRPNVKFSNTPGKESLGGNLRVFACGDVMVVGDASEPAPGEPLFCRLVANGRIVYDESFPAQADRADATWGRFRSVELSPVVKETMRRFNAMKAAETRASEIRLAEAGS